MPLVSIPEPFDHPEWLYEVKHDGFRALAIVEGHRCRLISRNGHVFSKWDVLGTPSSISRRALAFAARTGAARRTAFERPGRLSSARIG